MRFFFCIFNTFEKKRRKEKRSKLNVNKSIESKILNGGHWTVKKWGIVLINVQWIFARNIYNSGIQSECGTGRQSITQTLWLLYAHSMIHLKKRFTREKIKRTSSYSIEVKIFSFYCIVFSINSSFICLTKNSSAGKSKTLIYAVYL